MGENIDEVKLCLTTESGEVIELSEVPELTLDANDTECVSDDCINISRSCSFSLDFKLKGMTKLQLSLMGFPTTNNWRKMHGGVMDRRGA